MSTFCLEAKTSHRTPFRTNLQQLKCECVRQSERRPNGVAHLAGQPKGIYYCAAVASDLASTFFAGGAWPLSFSRVRLPLASAPFGAPSPFPAVDWIMGALTL